MTHRSSVSAAGETGGSPDRRDAEQRELMATLLPGGEPVESLLRKAQFFGWLSWP